MLQINFMINNIELHKLLYSDPYQYKDELKRIKNFLSPRQALSSNSSELNAAMNRVYNEGFKEGEIGYTDFTRDYFRTITMADVIAVGDLPGYGLVRMKKHLKKQMVLVLYLFLRIVTLEYVVEIGILMKKHNIDLILNMRKL